MNINGKRRERYDLVNAAHEFILTALPFRHRDSRAALHRFVAIADAATLPTPELQAVLLSLLAVLDPHTHGRLPGLVERYLSHRLQVPSAVARFQSCVEDVIRYRGIGDWNVQRAIAIIELRFCEASLTQADIADELGLSPQELSSLFKLHTGATLTAYLRDLRLDRAAARLSGTNERIKAVWVSAGFNDASNFDHQFHERFGLSPREYRARTLVSTLPPEPTCAHSPSAGAGRDQGGRTGALLLVEDNPRTGETLRQHLLISGYSVALVQSGAEAVSAALQSSFDAIVLDYHLPDMNGAECVKRLRADGRSATPGVLLFSADWEIEDEARALAPLGVLFVSKLCDLEELDRLVGSLVAIQSTLGEGLGRADS